MSWRFSYRKRDSSHVLRGTARAKLNTARRRMRWDTMFLTLLLGGCSSLMGVSPDVDYQVVVVAVAQQCDAPPAPGINPSTAMEIGFAKIQAACEVFFVDATRAQQSALATSQGLDAGLIGATAILNATTSTAAAAKAITITTAGVVFGKALINEYVSIYTFNTYLYKVRQHVMSSMEDYMTKARASPPLNYCLAYTYVQKLAALCTLAAMKANLDQQVALPSGIGTPPTGAPPPAARFQGLSRPAASFSRPSGPPPINYTVF
jgi:hypothetical protein